MTLVFVAVALSLGSRIVYCDPLYPFGNNNQHDEFTKTVPYTFTLSNSKHLPWAKKISQFTVKPAEGTMDWSGVTFRFWGGGTADMAANPGTHQYQERTINSDIIKRVKDDVTGAFGDKEPHNQFTPDEVDIITFTNFTFQEGNDSTEKNTVQFVTAYSKKGSVYWMFNTKDLGWYQINDEYPQIGIAYDVEDGTEAIRYDFPGSGTPEIQQTLAEGNTNVKGRWMFSLGFCSYPNCIEVPNGILLGFPSNVDQSNFRALCDKGYTGKMCETKIEPCASSPCIHGNCTTSEFTCACDQGYEGTLCDVMRPTCPVCPDYPVCPECIECQECPECRPAVNYFRLLIRLFTSCK